LRTPLGKEAAALYGKFVDSGEGGKDFFGIIRFLRGG
jgi:3-hydroxyisobutyrate dehydrogenase